MSSDLSATANPLSLQADTKLPSNNATTPNPIVAPGPAMTAAAASSATGTDSKDEYEEIREQVSYST